MSIAMWFCIVLTSKVVWMLIFQNLLDRARAYKIVLVLDAAKEARTTDEILLEGARASKRQ
jgi:hypothetical protein